MSQQLQGPVPIQLAIQGGGARLVTLIATLEAVQELQAAGVIKVTRVAGASAGALVGCLFAAGISMGELRTRLRGLHKDVLMRLFPTSRKRLLWRLGRRKPGWNDEPLRKELEKWFREVGVAKFGELKEKTGIEAIVMATNLTKLSKVVYKDDEELVVPSILSSCGLPYFLRVWNEGEVIVDGGICENFPAEELLDDTDKGEVLGISFLAAGSQPKTIVNFTMALLETAMTHSMNRAKRRLGSERVFTITTKITTFDFSEALNSLNQEYDLVKLKAREFFENYVDSAKNKQPIKQAVALEDWEGTSVSIMENLHRVYTAQHEPNKLVYKLGRLIVHANSLITDEKSYLYKKAPDHLEYFFTFNTSDQPVHCHAIGLSEANHDVSMWGGTELDAIDNSSNTTIDLVTIPMKRTSYPKDKSLLLWFLPTLQPKSGPYTLKCRELVFDLMRPLLDKGQDYLSINPLRSAGNIERVEIILCIPKDFGELTMSCSITNDLSRSMTATELANINIQHGFKAIGWVVQNAVPDSRIIVDFSKRLVHHPGE